MKRGRLFAVLLAAACPSVAQQDAELLQALAGRDPVAVERARRELLQLPPAAVPTEGLLALLADPATATAAVQVLAGHGLAAERLADPARFDDPAAQLAAVPFAALPALHALLAGGRFDGRVRAAALLQLHQRGELAAAELLAAIGERGELRRASRGLLAYGMPAWPAALWSAVPAEPLALLDLLEVLAEVPRPAEQPRVALLARDPQRPLPVRLLAIAAMAPADLDRELVRLVLHGLVDAAPTAAAAARTAVAQLPSGWLDAETGTVHQLVLQGASLERLLPACERMSAQAEPRLLAMAATLPPADTEALARWLEGRPSAALAQRVANGLDGKLPLEPWLLARAGGQLDRPGRVATVLAVLAHGTPFAQRLAGEVLAAAQQFPPALLQWASDQPDQRLRLQLVETGAKAVPDAFYLEALRAEGRLRRAALGALAHRGFGSGIAAELGAALPAARGGERAMLAHALLAGGGEGPAALAWKEVRLDPELAVAAIDWLRQVAAPWVTPLLLGELCDQERRPEADRLSAPVLAAIRLALAELGERRSAAELVAGAVTAAPAFVRRCRHALPSLDRASALRLLAAAKATGDGVDGDDLRTELLLWAGGCKDDAVQAGLLEMYHRGGAAAEAAMRGLMAGSGRTALVAELRQQLAAGASGEAFDLLAYETVATMPDVLAHADLRLLAELLLRAPLAAGDAELLRAQTFSDGRVGFPLANAVIDCLRRRTLQGDPAAAFAAVAAAVQADPRHRLLARQRLLCLWTAAAPWPDLAASLGAATAPLLLAIPDAADLGLGPAHLWLAQAAAARDADADAAAHYAIAARELLWAGHEPLRTRLCLGDADPDRGVEPRAALAAAPYLCRARAARAAGDLAAARAAATAAAALAGRDAASRAAATSLLDQLRP